MVARAFPGRTLILALAASGALTSSLLELIHYRAYAAPAEDSFCTLGEKLDCASVALSQYAVLLGVPLPVWGFAGFSGIGLAAWQGTRWLLPLAALAALAALVLSGVSAWGVGAWCLFCEVAHALSLIIFACAWRSRASLAGGLSARAALRAGSPAIGLLLAALLFLPRYWTLLGYGPTLPFAHGKTEQGDPWIGAEQPTLTLAEFVDYTCPHCKAASARSLQRLAAHPHQLRLVRRHSPRIPCQLSSETRCLPLRIALCADEQDRFWQADRWLFEHSQGGDVPEVARAASDLGLDLEQLARCVTSETTFQRSIAEWKRAKMNHLPGTPYYATGDRLVTGAAASAMIDAL
jgi:uncharacterized membrane protein